VIERDKEGGEEEGKRGTGKEEGKTGKEEGRRGGGGLI
jgi:hypothetical protein